MVYFVENGFKRHTNIVTVTYYYSDPYIHIILINDLQFKFIGDFIM